MTYAWPVVSQMLHITNVSVVKARRFMLNRALPDRSRPWRLPLPWWGAQDQRGHLEPYSGPRCSLIPLIGAIKELAKVSDVGSLI